jgi:hypothetical protein
MKMKPYNIELHIEELVLHGFSPKDRDAIGAAIQSELARLFAEQGAHPALQHTREVEKVDGGSFSMRAGAKAATIGTQVGQMVYGSLQQEQKSRLRTNERK